MKPIQHSAIALFVLLTLTGCVTSKTEEVALTEAQQKSYLAQTRPAQQFGLSVYPTQAGPQFSGAVRLHPNNIINADMASSKVPVIKMQGKSARTAMNALLDFSAPTSWLEFDTAQDLSAFVLGINDQPFPYRGGYNTGGVDAFGAVVTQMRIDYMFLENVPFYVRMAKNTLGPLARGIQSPRIDAILGNDNLKEFEYIQINLQENLIQFSTSTPYEPHEQLLMCEVKIVKLRNYGLAVEGAIFGEPTPILLDFAGDYHLARGDAKVQFTRQVSIGDIVHTKVPTLLLQPHNSPPKVGRQMLNKYIITICNKKGLVYFERPPKLSK